MQKCLVILLACAFMLAMDVPHAFAYPKAVAIITNYQSDNLNGRITIVRANGKPTGPEILLYPNDKITGDTGMVQLKLAPYTRRESEGGADIIKYTPPTAFEKIKDDVLDIYNSFWRSVEDLTGGITRGKTGTRSRIESVKLTPQPGFDVTLLSRQKVKFSWYTPVSKIFSITDGNGKKVFEKNVSGLTFIELDLKDAKLQAGKQYFWSVDNGPRNCKITILDKKTETKIFSKLDEIDSREISENERILKKVSYIQLLSDVYPEKVDLYWLSAQWLLNFKAFTEKEYDYQQFLLGKCLTHLKNKLPKN